LNHAADPQFWAAYAALPEAVERLADDCFQRLKSNPRHPSLHLKRVGRFWSARVGEHYRALAVGGPDGLVIFANTVVARGTPGTERPTAP
jgi:hypothetical protein